MKKRFIAAIMAAAMTVSLLAGCGSSEKPADKPVETEANVDTKTPAGDNTFTYAIGGDPGANVNPITSSDRWGLMTTNLIYSPLFKINGADITWYLATGYELSEDERTYTFHLRDDIQWSDGEKFTADDVIFTIEQMMIEENACEMYSNFVTEDGACEIKKIDDYTVSFTFPDASPAHFEAFAYQMYIEPKHVFEGITDYDSYQYDGPVVGTGPYILTEYSAGSYLKFEKNDKYFMNTPSIDTLVFRIIPSNDAASLAIQSGEIDAWATTPAYLEQIDLEANNLNVQAFNQSRIGYLNINCRKITDVKVRQAIFYALDKTQMATATYLNPSYYDEVYTFLPPNNAYYDDSEVNKYETDVEKAKSLLADAGVSGLKVKMGYSSDDANMETWALLAQEQLSAAGITVELAPMEQGAYYNELYSEDKDFDIFFGGYIMGSDPHTYAGLYTTGSESNYSGLASEAVDKLFADGIKTFDDTERKAIYKELQNQIQEEAAFFPIASNSYLVIFNNRVKGIEKCGLIPIYTLNDPSYLSLN